MKPGVKGTGNEQMETKPKVLKYKGRKKLQGMDEETYVKQFVKKIANPLGDEDEVQESKPSSGVHKKPNKFKLKRLAGGGNQERKIQRRGGQKLHKKKAGTDVQCFSCHCYGHQQRDCTSLDNAGMRFSCFRCSSTEHQIKDCPVSEADAPGLVKCFLCKKGGHMSRECPDNTGGLYPFGGGCWICGSKDHLKNNCPDYNKEKS